MEESERLEDYSQTILAQQAEIEEVKLENMLLREKLKESRERVEDLEELLEESRELLESLDNMDLMS